MTEPKTPAYPSHPTRIILRHDGGGTFSFAWFPLVQWHKHRENDSIEQFIAVPPRHALRVWGQVMRFTDLKTVWLWHHDDVTPTLLDHDTIPGGDLWEDVPRADEEEITTVCKRLGYPYPDVTAKLLGGHYPYLTYEVLI